MRGLFYLLAWVLVSGLALYPFQIPAQTADKNVKAVEVQAEEAQAEEVQEDEVQAGEVKAEEVKTEEVKTSSQLSTEEDAETEPASEPLTEEVPSHRYKIAYRCEQADASMGLCVVNEDGSDLHVLLSKDVDTAPVFSLEGEEIYFSKDQGEAEVPIGDDGLLSVPILNNMDVYSFVWRGGLLKQLTSNPEPEVPLQAFPVLNEIYISKGGFAKPSSELAADEHAVSITLRMLTGPCFHSLIDGECRTPAPVAAINAAANQTTCTPALLADPVGVSPNAIWATHPSLVCSRANEFAVAPLFTQEPGWQILNYETNAIASVSEQSVGTCRILDENNGLAVRDDGLLLTSPADLAERGAKNCKFFASPNQDRLAYLDDTGIIHVIMRDTGEELITMQTPLPNLTHLKWSPDAQFLLAYLPEGGTMHVVSLEEAAEPEPIGEGAYPSWSPIPLTAYSGLAVQGIEGTNLGATGADAAAQEPAASCSRVF